MAEAFLACRDTENGSEGLVINILENSQLYSQLFSSIESMGDFLACGRSVLACRDTESLRIVENC